MDFINFLRSKHFWISLLLAGLLLFAVIKYTMYYLNIYTHHGEFVIVPDLLGQNADTLEPRLKSQLLSSLVIDSTYFQGKPPGLVLDQDPEAGQKVKEGRKIYLTITRKIPPPISMPNLVDLNLVIAKENISKAGLRLGAIQYFPGLGKDLVLKQLYNDKEIPAGAKIPKGSKVDLVLSDGIGETKVDVPNLIGRTFREAKWTLTLLKLNLGYAEWDRTIQDSSTAVIYKQEPDFDGDSPQQLNYGETVDIYLTQTLPDYLRYSMDSTKSQ